MAKKILITGGSGLLALNWAAAMRDRCAVTLGLHSRRVDMPGAACRSLDLESVDALAATLESIGPDLVVHAAGMTNVEQCEASPDQAHRANVVLAENVAAACSKLGIALAHISTDHLFAGDEAMIEESHPVAPLNVYGKTKAEAEQRVLRRHPSALVVRTNFYGWGPAHRRSFSDVIIDALRAAKPVRLFHDVHYTPILIETLALAVHDLIEGGASGIVHVVGDERVSKYHFGIRVAEAFDFDPRLIHPIAIADIPGLITRPKDMSLSNRLACRTIGRPLGNLQEHLCLLRQQSSHPLRNPQVQA
ncbi:MAG: NAD(P)-dependent oxidoreductase [Planctomycetes bacterium]|nr:NAD(P)-dependent oxidoreductase [Planctomycetota bacterium]